MLSLMFRYTFFLALTCDAGGWWWPQFSDKQRSFFHSFANLMMVARYLNYTSCVLYISCTLAVGGGGGVYCCF